MSGNCHQHVWMDSRRTDLTRPNLQTGSGRALFVARSLVGIQSSESQTGICSAGFRLTESILWSLDTRHKYKQQLHT
jgi:hypothetical protein